MENGIALPPPPHNEPVLSYAPGTPERALLKRTLDELRTRFGKAEGEILTRARAALEDLDKAPIGTIHSFCAQLLRLHPVEAGVDPAFRELLLFTPQHRKAVAIEPYTCATDGANSNDWKADAGWRVLNPGEKFSAAVEYRLVSRV